MRLLLLRILATLTLLGIACTAIGYGSKNPGNPTASATDPMCTPSCSIPCSSPIIVNCPRGAEDPGSEGKESAGEKPSSTRVPESAAESSSPWWVHVLRGMAQVLRAFSP